MDGYKYAGFFKRVTAYIIDKFAIGSIWFFIMIPLFVIVDVYTNGLGTINGSENEVFTHYKTIAYFEQYNNDDLNPVFLFGIFVLLPVLVSWLYYALLESSKAQATVGKTALGIKVTDMYGNKISFLTASLRYLASFLSFVFFGVGYLVTAFTEKKQSLHDIIASTVVINKKYEYYHEIEVQNKAKLNKEVEYVKEELPDEQLHDDTSEEENTPY